MPSNGRMILSVAIFMCFNCLNCEPLVSPVCTQSLVGERQHVVPELRGGRRDLGKVICLDLACFSLLCKWLVCEQELLPRSFEALKTIFCFGT